VVQRRKQRADGTRHRRMNAGILVQNRCEQRGAAARQPRYEVVVDRGKSYAVFFFANRDYDPQE
jgi:hypothetical protein